MEALGEMHILAYCYHWPSDRLWNMGRSERHLWAELVRMQKEVESESIKGSGDEAAPSSSNTKDYKESS